jgi:ribosomal protein S18 acetylase RimI-like enzyme
MSIRRAYHDDEPDLFAFLRSIDNSFDPPLSTRIDLRQWLKKVLTLGVILVSSERQKLEGVIAFYCNDRERQQAFISVLGIAEAARGQGIGKKLLQEAIDIFRSKRMKSALVTTWAGNRAAISLYEMCGFKEDIEESKKSGKITLRLTL